MKILITGGTGFIGQHLIPHLLKRHYQLTVLTRQQAVPWLSQAGVTLCHNLQKFKTLDPFDTVINLAGAPIFDRYWSHSRKQQLYQSRIQLTTQLAQLIQHSAQPPDTFISGSATGYYGNITDKAMKAYQGSEQTPMGNGFAADLCHHWEQAALTAQSQSTRVCLLRTGLVLSPQGGILKRILPFYRWGLGGKLGSGRQHWAWIHLSDYIHAILHLLDHTNQQGAFNLVAPNPIPQHQFNQQLATQLKRPAFCHTPACLLKGLLGERVQLLLDSQPLQSQALFASGFTFRYPTFNNALDHLLQAE